MRIRPLRSFVVLALVLAAAPAAGAAPSTANLWVDADGGTCTRSGSAVTYSTGAACGSLDAAYDAASAGDVVVIKSGSYSGQTVTGTKSSPGVSFVGESGVSLASLSEQGDYVSLTGVEVDSGSAHGASAYVSADHVALSGVDLHGSYPGLYVEDATYVSWSDSELGEANATGGERVCGQDVEPLTLDNAQGVTVDGVAFHPQDRDETNNGCSANGFHLETIRIDSGTSDVVVRNSTFDSGDHANTSTVFITQPGAGTDPHDLTFEDNFFGSNDSSPGAFDVSSTVGTCEDVRVAYNTILSGTGAWQCATMTDVAWVGNLATRPSYADCPGTSFAYNVWQDQFDSSCDASDTWVSGTRFATDALGLTGDGFHITSGSPAVSAGDPSDCPATDHDGDARPNGTCDAGADEYVAPGDTTPPTVSITAPSASSTVSGASVSVTASASDDVGVVGVQFKLDGVALGAEDTVSPYAITWNTTAATNGSHTLTAVARDAATNTTTSSSVTVTVSNVTTLLGSTSILTNLDTNATGRAEAFRTSSLAAGTLAQLKFYLDSTSTASSVIVGVYSNASGHPSSLLTSGTVTSPAAGAWNSVSVSTTAISSGTTYWIAILAPTGSTGTIEFRDTSAGTGAAETSASGSLTALPGSWTRQTTYTDGPLSAYGTT